MRKSEFTITIVCPFDHCRMDVDSRKMGFGCLNCGYSELVNEKTGDVIKLNENSKEYKAFMMKYYHDYENDTM